MKNTNNKNSNKKLKLVLSYLVHVVDRLGSVYNLSFEDACKAVEDLDLINLYKYDYDFILHENIMTWVDLAYKQYTRNKLQKPDDKVKLKFTGNDSYIDDNDTADNVFNDCKPIVLDNKVKFIMENAAPKHVDKNDRLQEGVDALNDFKLSSQEMKDNFNKLFDEQKEKLLHYKPEIWYKVYNKQPTTKNTIAGDIVLYDNQMWFNTGNIVAPMQYAGLEDWVDPDGTIRNTKKESDDTNMDNYIMINGKKLELTEEQLKQLGIEVDEKRNSPFDRVSRSESYYFIHSSDNVNCAIEDCPEVDHHYFDNANYFNDTDFANQVMLHQQLYRKLLKYAYDNNAEDREWDKANVNSHYFIYFDSAKGHFVVGDNHYCHSQSIYFSSENVAKQAIEDIIEPFIAEHPEFIW